MKLTPRIIGLILAGLFVLFVIVAGPAACNRIRSLTAQSKVNDGQMGAFRNSSSEAIETVGNVAANQAASDELGRRNAEEIGNAEGAGNSIGTAVNDAFLRAACRRQASRNDPKCRVYQPDPR